MDAKRVLFSVAKDQDNYLKLQGGSRIGKSTFKPSGNSFYYSQKLQDFESLLKCFGIF